MGKGTNVSICCNGVKIKYSYGVFADDRNSISACFDVIGYDKVKHIYDQSPELQQALDDAEMDFPEDGNEL